jgi:hypothetical protein
MPPTKSEKDEADELHDVKLRTLQELLGSSGDNVLHAVMPVWMEGGQSSIHTFEKHVPGVAYVTCDLVGWAGQKRNKQWENYELMICTRDDEKEAPNLISRLGAYTLETALNPGETMDIGPAVPQGSAISAFFFTKPEVRLPFKVQGIKSGIILCVGITASELKYRHKAGPEKLVEKLKNAAVFPFTDWKRQSVI